MSGLQVLPDTPASNDVLDFKARYVAPLLSAITSGVGNTPLTIGVFGTWGSGKSTVLRLLDRELQSQYTDQAVRVHFNPWYHRQEPQLLVPLLHTIHDTLDTDPQKRFAAIAKRLGSIIAKLGAGWVLGKVFGKSASLEDLKKAEKTYLESRGQVQSEIRRLRGFFQAEAAEMAKAGARMVLFVDDLDRCEPTEVIDLLESVKLFLDVPNVVVVIAVDKEVIDRGIQVKYSQYDFARDREAQIGAEYLEKFIQLPLPLYPLHLEQVKGYLTALEPPPIVAEHLTLLARAVPPNPRKIKRIVNLFAVTAAVLESSPRFAKLDPALLLRLMVIRSRSPELFARLTQLPRAVVAMEAVYQHKKNAGVDEDFLEYGAEEALVRELCRRWCRPCSYLTHIFERSEFAASEDRMDTYLSLFPG